MSNIELVITPRSSDLGDNFIVRRSLPFMNKRTVGPFIFWDHMGPAKFTHDKEMTVRAHPHIGLATITYLFDGYIMHRDSLGTRQLIRPNEINWMTAGSGIAHSERVQPKAGEEVTVHGIQVWVALPKEFEEVAPSFAHHKESELPLIEVEGGAKFRLIVGEAFGKKSEVKTYSDMFYLSSEMKDCQFFSMQMKASHEGAVYVAQGEIEVEGKKYGESSMVCFKAGSEIIFQATADSIVMVLGGEVLPEKRFIWWNFVSSSQERLEQAKADWKEGRFVPVIDEKEYIPLPDK